MITILSWRGAEVTPAEHELLFRGRRHLVVSSSVARPRSRGFH